MGKSTENGNKKSFLTKGFKGDISKHHKKYLGTDVPEGYFVKSKISILDKIKVDFIIEEPKEIKKQLVFSMEPQFKYLVAASLVFALSLTVWLQNSNKIDTINETNFELLAFSDDVLFDSLFIDETEFEVFTDVTLFNEVVVKAELSEQKLDNLILDNLILGDSLLDHHINDVLVETIIL